MSTLAQLMISLGLDASGLTAGTSQAKGTLSGLERNLNKVGKTMTAAVTVPLIGMGVAAINSASDTAESLNKVTVVFGENAREMIQWSESSAAAFGMSQQQALEAVGTYGNLFRAMKVGADDTAVMSRSLVELAADLASFNNIDPTVALEKLRAGITGESEPLKTLGVVLSQARVEAKALELGFEKVGSTFETNALVAARYAIILEDTAAAHGDFTNTADGLANSQRIIAATLKDVASTFGMELLPLATAAAAAIKQLLSAFQGLSPGARQAIVVLLGVVAAIGPVLLIAAQLVASIGTIGGAFGALGGVIGPAVAGIVGVLGTIGAPILLIVGLVAALYIAWQNNFLGIQDIAQNVLGWLSTNIPETFQNIGATITGFVADAKSKVASLTEGVSREFGNIQAAATEKTEGLRATLSEKFTQMTATMTGLVSGLKDQTLGIFGLLKAGGEVLMGAFSGSIAETMLRLTVHIVSGLRAAKEQGLAAVRELVSSVLSALGDLSSGAFEKGAALARQFGAGITSALSSALGAARDLAGQIRSLLPGSDAQIGPLSDLFKSGQALATTFARGFTSVSSEMREQVAVGLPAMGRVAQPAGAGGNSTSNQEIHVTINNPVGLPAEGDIVRQLRNLQFLGVLDPVKRSATA